MRSLIVLVAVLAVTSCVGRARQAEGAREGLRVLVYNIHAGKDAEGVDNLARVAEVVREADADLALLQEVDRGTERSGRVDQVAELARLTGRYAAFGKSLDYQGGHYGIALLSRWPVVAESTVHLQVTPAQTRSGGSREPRVLLHATVVTGRGDTLDVLNTHIDASRVESFRMQEAATIGDVVRALALRRRRGGLLLLGGDFNSTPESAVHARVEESGVRDAWPGCGAGSELTYPSAAPIKRIDYLFLLPPARCTTARVLDSSASDHRPVLLTVAR
ncbi:MAG TPA: endonuclease/exonuclease/phosphatase family protein [Gemmatimonadaceae bacterium]|nr:endonuclease/exonuclease/phosphatase family protein [Gemmatimonadaceae bacterium]